MRRWIVATAVLLLFAAGITVIVLLQTRSNEPPAPAQPRSIAILVPVRIQAIDSFVDHASTVLEKQGMRVAVLSAEGDAARFETILKAALLKQPDALILFGTQLTETALGPQFKDSLPPTIASAISSPPGVESLVRIGLSPPRAAPVAIISDSPKRDIYAQSAGIITELLHERPHKVGILYNESERNSLTTAQSLAQALTSRGMTVRHGVVSGADNVLAVAKTLLMENIGILLIPHDKYVLPQTASIVKLCLEASPDKPTLVFSLDDGVVRDSGVPISVSVSYERLGQMTGDICMDVLRGARPEDLPIVALNEAAVYVNRSAMERFRCSLSAETLAQAIVVDE